MWIFLINFLYWVTFISQSGTSAFFFRLFYSLWTIQVSFLFSISWNQTLFWAYRLDKTCHTKTRHKDWFLRKMSHHKTKKRISVGFSNKNNVWIQVTKWDIFFLSHCQNSLTNNSGFMFIFNILKSYIFLNL